MAMAKRDKAAQVVALGSAPHSGWAAVVGVGEAEGGVHVLLRERVEMADAADAEAKQPYHAVEDLPEDQAARRLARWSTSAESRAHAALRHIVDGLATDGHRVAGLGILDSAGRKGDSLAAILASHALIHTADGDHFRAAIAAAAARCRMPVTRIRAHDLEGQASAALGTPIERLRDTVKALGREVGPPWGADQKAAALLAWLVLKKG